MCLICFDQAQSAEGWTAWIKYSKLITDFKNIIWGETLRNVFKMQGPCFRGMYSVCTSDTSNAAKRQ